MNYVFASAALAIIEGQDGSDSKQTRYVSFSELGQKAGDRITSNSVAAGACLSLMGAPFDIYRDVLRERLRSKGDTAVENNIRAAMLGYEAVAGTSYEYSFDWQIERTPGILKEATLIELAYAFEISKPETKIEPFQPPTCVNCGGTLKYIASILSVNLIQSGAG